MRILSKIITFSLFLFVLSLYSCHVDEGSGGTVNIRFKLMYGTEPMEMFKQYKYPVTNDLFYLTRLSFFISDLKVKSNTSEELLKEVDYINLSNAYSGGIPTNGFQYEIKEVRPGEYTSLQFGIGVPATLNNKQPKDFPANSILSSSAEYWSSWKSYIFFRPEGKIGLNQSTTIDTDFALHLGANDAYRNIKLNRSISVKNDVVTDVDVLIDMEKFFNGKTLYDMYDTQQIHSLEQMPLIIDLVNNLVEAIK